MGNGVLIWVDMDGLEITHRGGSKYDEATFHVVVRVIGGSDTVSGAGARKIMHPESNVLVDWAAGAHPSVVSNEGRNVYIQLPPIIELADDRFQFSVGIPTAASDLATAYVVIGHEMTHVAGAADPTTVIRGGTRIRIGGSITYESELRHWLNIGDGNSLEQGLGIWPVHGGGVGGGTTLRSRRWYSDAELGAGQPTRVELERIRDTRKAYPLWGRR